MEKLLLYSAQQNKIGGIERQNINFCKRMSKYYDITFVYDYADSERLKDIKKYAKTEINDGRKFETDICLYGTSWGTIGNFQIKAKLYPQMIHADLTQYKESMFFTYNRRPMVTKHVSVGKNVANSLKKEYGYDSTVIYNLLDDDIKYEKHEKKSSTDVLKIIVVSRISGEKGFERLIKTIEMLKKKGRKFVVDIYGDSYNNDYERFIKSQLKKYKEVVFHGSKWTLTQEMHDADYLFQLSDTEGMPYSPREALQVGTPVVLTDFPSAHEIVEDGVNGYILDMNLNNLDIDKLYNNIPINFEYKEESTEQDWLKFLEYNPNEKFRVKNKKGVIYDDINRGKQFSYQDAYRWEKLPRVLELINAGFCEVLLKPEETKIIKETKTIKEININNILELLKKE